MNDSIYKKSFELFLRRTDEKSVIEKFIINNIKLNKKTKFLDIGAGDGFFDFNNFKKSQLNTCC